jgi:hypothetical protein
MRSFSCVASVLAIVLGVAASGCAATVPRPVETNAALGKVVVYRNGVAYFERYARLQGQALKLRVPGERLDDLLKSLTVVDAATGKPVPASFPTLEHVGDEVEIVVQLPQPAPRELRISYVTESPAWKPSYRLKLSQKGPAKLEAWAVVDNVSGEDWKRVSVGVGSTSALSFRYDLHSVRFVERETLTDGTRLGAAPPTGGSPYSVAGKELQVLANVSVDELEQANRPSEVSDLEASPAAAMGVGSGRGQREEKSRAPRKAAKKNLDDSLAGIAARAQSSKEKIRIEGYALSGDGDRAGASLQRANAVRDKLLGGGVPPAQIEVVGTGRVAQGDAVRILAVQGETQAQQAQPRSEGAAPADEPLGNAYFLSKTPLSIDKGSSALVSMLNTEVQALPVYYYDPISARGSKKFAFRAVLLDNPTEHTLDAGPVTVYADGQFLGEGMSDAIPAKTKAFIPFALDRKLVVETELGGREAIDRLVTIQRGIVTAEARSIRTTKLSFHNRGTTPAVTYVRHATAPGHALEAPLTGFEKLRGAYLIPVTVPAGGTLALTIEESTPIQKSVDVRTDGGVKELALFLKTAGKLPEELKQKLDQVIEMHRELGALDERLSTIGSQIAMYRSRVDELNAQLVTLRRVTQAQELSRKLAKKMEEISEKLQQATLEAAGVEGQRLTRRVALEDRLAELTLESRREAVAGR